MSRQRKQASAPDLAGASQPHSPRATTAGPAPWVAAVVLAASISLVYGPALDAPLIFDDEVSIVTNPSISHLWPPIGTAEQPGPLRSVPDLPTAARPLVNLSFATNYFFGGLSPTGYHAVNMVIHFLAALLMWSVVRRTLVLPVFGGQFTLAAGWLALAVALLWALHPLQTEAVIYATQRTELMMAFFYLATLYCSLRYWEANSPALSSAESQAAANLSCSGGSVVKTGRPKKWLLLAALACLGGMASKEVMVSAPFVVLLFDRAFISRSLSAAWQRSRPLYVALAATWLLLLALNLGAPRGSSAGFHLGVSAYSWWLTQCRVLLIYLKLAVWPAPLLLHYELPYLTTFADAWMYVLPVVLVALVAIVLLYRNRLTGFLLASFAAILAPTFVVPIATEMAAERRMYLPLAILVALLVVGGYRGVLAWWQRRPATPPTSAAKSALRLSIMAVTALAIACGFASSRRLADYHDEMLLWRQVVEHQPNNCLAHYNLGLALNHAGRSAESFAELQAAVAANPHHPDALSAFGFALIHAGRVNDAIESLRAALAVQPAHAAALNNLGLAYLELGDDATASAYFESALRANPNHAQAHNNLGRTLARTGHSDAALEHLQAAAALAPDDPDVLNNLATVIAAQGNLPQAIELLERTLVLRPDFAPAHNSLGIALYQSGNAAAAVEHLRRFLDLNPNNPGAYCNLANVLAGQGDFRQAAGLFQQAVKLQPNSAEAHYSLGTALVATNQLPAAIEHFQQALKLRPNLHFAYLNLAQALAAAGRAEEAIQAAQQGLAVARTAADQTTAAQLEQWLQQNQPKNSDNVPNDQ